MIAGLKAPRQPAASGRQGCEGPIAAHRPNARPRSLQGLICQTSPGDGGSPEASTSQSVGARPYDLRQRVEQRLRHAMRDRKVQQRRQDVQHAAHRVVPEGLLLVRFAVRRRAEQGRAGLAHQVQGTAICGSLAPMLGVRPGVRRPMPALASVSPAAARPARRRDRPARRGAHRPRAPPDNRS